MSMLHGDFSLFCYDLPYQTQHRLMNIVKYELAFLLTKETAKRHCRCTHTRALLCRILCGNHATSTALHMWNKTPFSAHNFARPTWTKTAQRKWIQFTWNRNSSNHEFHLDTETSRLLIAS